MRFNFTVNSGGKCRGRVAVAILGFAVMGIGMSTPTRAEWAPPPKMAYILPSNEMGYTRWHSGEMGASADGRYRVTQKPEFLGNGMVYSLTDLVKKRTAWRVKHGSFTDLTGWQEAFVSDDGWTVFRDDGDNAQVITPDGHPAVTFNFVWPPTIPKRDVTRYAEEVTDGPSDWGESFSRIYFTRLNGRTYFCVHYWWGRRAVFDLADRRQVTDQSRLSGELDREERAWVMGQLKKGVDQIALLITLSDPNRAGDPGKFMWDTMMAMYMSGKMNMRDAVPLLRRLEPISFSGAGSIIPGDDVPVGKIDPFEWDTFTFRNIAHLSLRRLGAPPQPYPETQLKLNEPAPDYSRDYTPPPLPAPRAERMRLVRRGESAEAVMAAIGAPDYISNDTWDYDMDARPPFTLRLHWIHLRVKSVERIEPAAWQRGDRDQTVTE
jgi:hypothetical protein